MITVLLSILIVVLSAGGLAIGLLFGRAPVKGSCGGLNCRNCARIERCRRDS